MTDYKKIYETTATNTGGRDGVSCSKVLRSQLPSLTV